MARRGNRIGYVKVDARSVRRSLKAMADPRVVGVEAGNKQAAQTARDAVRREAPVASGALQSSVDAKKASGSTSWEVTAGNAAVDYVPTILGGRKSRAPFPGNPFIARGIEKAAPSRLKGYNQAIRRAIRKLGF